MWENSNRFEVSKIDLTWYVLTIPPLVLLLLSLDALDEGESPKISVKIDEDLKSAADNGASCEVVGPSFEVAIFSLVFKQ
jgi:hypothetical protein